MSIVTQQTTNQQDPAIIELEKFCHTSERYQRGKRLALYFNVIKVPHSDKYWCESETDPEVFYTVKRTRAGLICDCADFETRSVFCKHCYAVLYKETLGMFGPSKEYSQVEG